MTRLSLRWPRVLAIVVTVAGIGVAACQMGGGQCPQNEGEGEDNQGNCQPVCAALPNDCLPTKLGIYCDAAFCPTGDRCQALEQHPGSGDRLGDYLEFVCCHGDGCFDAGAE